MPLPNPLEMCSLRSDSGCTIPVDHILNLVTVVTKSARFSTLGMSTRLANAASRETLTAFFHLHVLRVYGLDQSFQPSG